MVSVQRLEGLAGGSGQKTLDKDIFQRFGKQTVLAHAKDVTASADADDTELPATGKGMLGHGQLTRLDFHQPDCSLVGCSLLPVAHPGPPSLQRVSNQPSPQPRPRLRHSPMASSITDLLRKHGAKE